VRQLAAAFIRELARGIKPGIQNGNPASKLA
jgi:hypothetical protein